MKKIRLMMLALLVISLCFSITACGGGGGSTIESTQTQDQPQTPTTVPAAATEPDSGSSGSWGIPIYPGAKETFKVKSDQNEILNDKPAVLESRVYTTSADKDDVVAFYKDKMPANGWTETMWSDIGAGLSSMGQYDKNDGQELALVSCSVIEAGGTMIKLDWKYVK